MKSQGMVEQVGHADGMQLAEMMSIRTVSAQTQLTGVKFQFFPLTGKVDFFNSGVYGKLCIP